MQLVEELVSLSRSHYHGLRLRIVRRLSCVLKSYRRLTATAFFHWLLSQTQLPKPPRNHTQTPSPRVSVFESGAPGRHAPTTRSRARLGRVMS